MENTKWTKVKRTKFRETFAVQKLSPGHKTHTYFDTPTTQIQVHSSIVVAKPKKKKKPGKNWTISKARRAQFIPVIFFATGSHLCLFQSQEKNKQIYHWNPSLPMRQKRERERAKELVDINIVSSGVRTHAPLRRPELESGALDHSAMLTAEQGLLTVGFEPTPFRTRTLIWRLRPTRPCQLDVQRYAGKNI